MGRTKTVDKIKRRYYWPNQFIFGAPNDIITEVVSIGMNNDIITDQGKEFVNQL